MTRPVTGSYPGKGFNLPLRQLFGQDFSSNKEIINQRGG
jgi:hypothetical protein